MLVRVSSLAVLALLSLAVAPSAKAQAIGFQPVIAEFPNGVGLNVTPVVSADRRYVRMGIDTQFTSLEGFTTVQTGGGITGGFGGRGGGGGGGGGFGGLGGGGRGGAGGGGGGVAGMNGFQPLGNANGPLLAFQGGASSEATAVLAGEMELPRSPLLGAGTPAVERPRAVKASSKKTKATVKKRH